MRIKKRIIYLSTTTYYLPVPVFKVHFVTKIVQYELISQAENIQWRDQEVLHLILRRLSDVPLWSRLWDVPDDPGGGHVTTTIQDVITYQEARRMIHTCPGPRRRIHTCPEPRRRIPTWTGARRKIDVPRSHQEVSHIPLIQEEALQLPWRNKEDWNLP